jgi:hypothetical protein
MTEIRSSLAQPAFTQPPTSGAASAAHFSGSQAEDAALTQYLNQLCAALAETTRFQPEPRTNDALESHDAPSPNTDEAEPNAPDSVTELAGAQEMTNADLGTQNTDAELADRTSNLRNASSPLEAPSFSKTELPHTDFWDAVAAQHAAQGVQQPSNESSVFDAVAQVAANRQPERRGPERAPELTPRTQTPSTQETERQSIDIIAAFESLFGIEEPDPSTQRPRELLRQNAERAVFAALTFAEGTTLSAAGRRG